MINIEEIEKQAQALQACVNNYKSAKDYCNEAGRKYLGGAISFEDCVNSNNILDRCEQTLICQLKLMNIQNEKLLK